MQNENTGIKVSIDLTAPVNFTVEGKTAEWITEDFMVNKKYADFAAFEQVEWTNCQVWVAPLGSLRSTVMFNPSQSLNRHVVDIAQQGKENLTTSETTGANITTKYGPHNGN